MKTSLKSLADSMKPGAAERTKKAKPVLVATSQVDTTPRRIGDAPSYRVAQTRTHTRQISAHYPGEAVQAFRVLAAELDRDVQELLAEAINMTFERHGKPDRIDIVSGRRKRIER